MKVTYTNHAKQKIALYGLDRYEIEQAVTSLNPSYFDTRDNTVIIIARISLKVGVRPAVIVLSSGITPKRVVTVYPCSKLENEINRKLRSGRWIKLEKN